MPGLTPERHAISDIGALLKPRSTKLSGVASRIASRFDGFNLETNSVLFHAALPPHRSGMSQSSIEPVSLAAESSTAELYDNHVVANVNDHVVRISVMTGEYHWHCHPDSDESFIVLEGGLIIELDEKTIELIPGQLFTVRQGIRHRTRPIGERSVNLTFERKDAMSQPVAPPAG